jgi:hypothetical protein
MGLWKNCRYKVDLAQYRPTLFKRSAVDQKAAQVQMMGTTYSTANIIIVWLAPSRNDSNIMEVCPRFG